MGEGRKRLVLVDGNAILHRAYHALPALTTRGGELVNAVYGFASMLFKIFADLHPEYLAVAFDTAAPNFRHAEFVGYKANRPRMDSELAGQIERVHELVRAFNIPIIEVDGYEADDVIGSLAKKVGGFEGCEGFGEIETIIVTGDKDLMQLVNDKVQLYMPTKGLSEGTIVGVEEVKEKMGVAPEQIADYKGLVGDPSDNYPGVSGIGPKTATELLKRFGSVEGVYSKMSGDGGGFGPAFAKASAGKGFGESVIRKLAEGAEDAVLSKKLATVLTDVPVKLDLAEAVAKDYDKEKVLTLFKELGFRSLIGRIEGNKENKVVDRKKGKHEEQQSLF